MKKRINDYEFAHDEQLTEYVIPDGITKIGLCAFWGCTSLQSVTIPDSVMVIGTCAFKGCTSLKTVTIPRGCRYYHAFDYQTKVIIR